MSYTVNEIFYSLQGEGMRCGEASLFLRFAKCNMRCTIEEGPRSPGGFDCDTEFESGQRMSIDHILSDLNAAGTCEWIVLTGGEPGLQVDDALITALHAEGYKLAIETNGSIALPRGLDWITVSPKVAEHAIKQRTAAEVKYVRGYGQAVPQTVVTAEHYLLSPAFNGLDIDARAMQWCIDLCLANPSWRLSMQAHKLWGMR